MPHCVFVLKSNPCILYSLYFILFISIFFPFGQNLLLPFSAQQQAVYSKQFSLTLFDQTSFTESAFLFSQEHLKNETRNTYITK